MSFIEILLIAVSLCFDTLAVALAGGACIRDINWKKKVRIIFSFALFQGGFTFAGWLLGVSVSHYIEKFDHWVAFALLLYIGGKMIFDSFHGGEGDRVDLLNVRKLIISSIATSIDALAVGVSFAFIEMSALRCTGASSVIFAITAIAAALGLEGGEKLGKLLGGKSSLAGGVILIAIGVKILLEHLSL